MRFLSVRGMALLLAVASACAMASTPAAAISPASSRLQAPTQQHPALQQPALQQRVPDALQPALGQALAHDVNPQSWIESKVIASDGAASAEFGYSVSISGTIAIIGAPEANAGQGAAYVFTESGGVWTEVSRLAAADGLAGDNFGWSVSLSGSNALISARAADSNRGAAYVFTSVGSTWTQTAKLVADDGVADDRFGNTVVISGSTALISAATATIGANTWQGAGYIFTESGGTWTQGAKLIADDGVANDQLGVSVALDGDTAVMGTPLNGFFTGAAYVFAGPTWAQTQKITAADGGPFSGFGASVAVRDSTLVVGANLASASVGAAYVFTESGATWTQQQKVDIADGEPGANFGVSASLSGTTLVVGAGRTDGANGAAYVFEDNAGTWIQSRKLTASDAADATGFAYSVSVDNGIVTVGAGQATVGGNVKQGATYFYADDAGAADDIFCNGFESGEDGTCSASAAGTHRQP